MKNLFLYITFLFFSFFNAIPAVLGIDIDNFDDQVLRPDNLPTGTAAANAPVEVKINSLFQFGINLILFASGAVAVFFLIFGGIQYVTSLGNQERMDGARKTITNALIGLVVVIFSFAIVTNIIDFIFRATV